MKFQIGDILVLTSQQESWNNRVVKLVRYQNDMYHIYIVRPIYAADEYGATEKCLRKLTKLDKALK